MTAFRRRALSIETAAGAGEVAVLEFGDPTRPVDVIFSHGNGFNAMTHRQALEPLGETLRIVAIDQRGHGRTRLPTAPDGRQTWRDLVDDLLAVTQALELSSPVVLAGHSMGGSISVMAAPRLAGLVKSLVLFDPVIAPQMVAPDEPMPEALIAFARMASQRRDLFSDKAAAVEAYRGRGVFKSWPDVVLADYVEDGFIEGREGARLSCSPAWEASNYLAQRQPMLDYLLASDLPIHLLKAGIGSTCHVRPDDPKVMTKPNLRIETIERATHLLPVERPDLVRKALLEA